jgi:hypothetical protein
MTGTTYYAATADQELAQAQQVLDTHVTSSVDGLCHRCGTPGPCQPHESATQVFTRRRRLPRRRPGITLTARVAGSPVSWFGEQ